MDQANCLRMTLVEKCALLMEMANHCKFSRTQAHINGKTVRNVVYVPGRPVNVVVG